MDRRHFLHNINALGFGAFLPSWSSNKQVSLREAQRRGNPGLRIGIVGVGGAGGAILSYLAESIPYLGRSVAINTDADSLQRRDADRKILVADVPDEPIISNAARRLAVRRNAWSAVTEIENAVADLDVVLLVAGMGGVAGTVISPVVAQVLREQNIYTVGFPILPFDFEGQERGRIARRGARELGRHIHSLIPIFNEAFAQTAGENDTIDDIYNQAALAILQHFQRMKSAVAASRFGDTAAFA